MVTTIAWWAESLFLRLFFRYTYPYSYQLIYVVGLLPNSLSGHLNDLTVFNLWKLCLLSVVFCETFIPKVFHVINL